MFNKNQNPYEVFYKTRIMSFIKQKQATHDISQVALKYFNHKTHARTKMIKITF